MSWLDKAFFRGLVSIQTAGTAMPAETAVNFTGAGVVVTDDPANGRTNVAIAGGGGGGLPAVISASVTKSANYTIVGATDFQIEMITNTGFTVTLPAAPSGLWQFVIVNNTAGNNTVGGNGHNLSSTGSTSMTLAAGQSVTCTWSSASSMWLIT